MTVRFHRRTVIAALPIFLGGLAGCTGLSDGSRVILIEVINQTDEHLTAEIEVREGETVLAEQRVDLPDERPDAEGVHSRVGTQFSVGEISEGSTLTAELVVDDHRSETVNFTADCDVGDEYTGDGVSFRIRDDFINTHTGFCTTEELPR